MLVVNFRITSVDSYKEVLDILLHINIRMDEKNLPSSSDESDADFVPKEEEDNSHSGSEVSDYETSEGENSRSESRKRKKKTKKYDKKAKRNKSEDKEIEDKLVEKKHEIDVDALWADFKKDVNNVEAKKTADSSYLHSKREAENLVNKSEISLQKNPLNAKAKGNPNFSNIKKMGGLSKVLNKIGKKDKMSTLQKSQMDWNTFKKSEGIEEEIKMYNRGKDGYLEKQDFLQRTDLRQFEIEKDLRSSRRKF